MHFNLLAVPKLLPVKADQVILCFTFSLYNVKFIFTNFIFVCFFLMIFWMIFLFLVLLL